MRVRGLVITILLVVVWVTGATGPQLRAQGKAPSRVALKGARLQRASGFGLTQRVDQLPRESPAVASTAVRSPEKIRAIRNPKVRGSSPTGAVDEWTDMALQPLLPAPGMPVSSVSFDGLSSQDNFNSFGFRVSPPDTNGAVGPSHYVEQTNMLVRVYTKAGAPVTAPFRLSSLFASAGVCSVDDDGDPVVLYDPLANRWILSQFGFVSISGPPYHQCIAVSQTGDPAGAYFAYDFVTPGVEFPDYPKLGVWPDGYYMSVNQFNGGGPFDGTGVYAFDRARMLAGDPTAAFVYFNLDLASHPEGIGGTLPSSLDGLRPPPAGAPNVFAYFLATEFGDGMDGLRLFSFHADFITPANSTFTERAESPLHVAAFDPLVSRIPQPGTPATLDTLSDRLMHRLQYRNTGAAETLVVTHTVDADPTIGSRAAIRYYELRRTGGAYSVFEQATFSPDTTQRWMGSAAEDNQGNLAVGYSAGGSALAPSIRYAGRLSTDPAGSLAQGESTLVTGTGVQTSTGHRWGDYSALMVDPIDDCTFWYTTEYYTLASQGSSAVGWLTRIGAFKFAGCTAPAKGTIAVTVTGCVSGAPVPAASVSVDGALYGVTNAAGQLTVTVLPGTHTVSASASGASGSQSVSVTAGATEGVALCLGSSSSPPDLLVSNLSAPSKSGAGLSFTIKDTTSNIGSGASAASTTRFWLSVDATPEGGVTILGSRAIAPLPAASADNGSIIATIPAGTPGGVYYIVARADANDAIAEGDETNNVRARKILVGPDLRVLSLTTPDAATRGTAIAITDITSNAGKSTTGGTSVTRFYLSVNRTVGSSDVLLGSRTVGVLGPGDISEATTIVTIPAGTSPGPYHIIAVADGTSVVTEANEKNNKRVGFITINP